MRTPPQRGAVARDLLDEFPGLGIASLVVPARRGRSPEAVRERLRVQSDRFYGAQAIRLREQPVPWAYRVFFRQIGLDPDTTRTPIEELTLERLHDGGLKSRGMPVDAVTVATAETGVALTLFDADLLTGTLRIRGAEPGERLPGAPVELTPGALVVADDDSPLGLLFGETADEYAVSAATAQIAVVAIQVGGIPDLTVYEAIWQVAETLAA